MKHIGSKTIDNNKGQSLVEFALLLPLFVLIVVGIFDLGRAFFSWIAISNAAREGVRVYTFSPDKTTLPNIRTAVDTEIGTSSVVDESNVASIDVQCYLPGIAGLSPVTTDAQLKTCTGEQPIVVSVTYTQTLILSFFFPQPLMLHRSAEMMVP